MHAAERKPVVLVLISVVAPILNRPVRALEDVVVVKTVVVGIANPVKGHLTPDDVLYANVGQIEIDPNVCRDEVVFILVRDVNGNNVGKSLEVGRSRRPVVGEGVVADQPNVSDGCGRVYGVGCPEESYPVDVRG